MKKIYTFILITVIILGIVFVFVDLWALAQFIGEYPNDTLNINFFYSKVIRSFTLWFLVLVPITIFINKAISFKNKKKYVGFGTIIVLLLLGVSLVFYFTRVPDAVICSIIAVIMLLLNLIYYILTERDII